MVIRKQLGPDETHEHAAAWIASAHPQARRALFDAYVALYREEEPDFDLAAFTELVRSEIARRRAEQPPP